jgi:hypothetical protein
MKKAALTTHLVVASFGATSMARGALGVGHPTPGRIYLSFLTQIKAETCQSPVIGRTPQS